uniref:RNase H type-1 domain-containing protein n=1 Tax=Cannabis sativa TaxID=3483 RepID=A0A803QRG5_CANSA
MRFNVLLEGAAIVFEHFWKERNNRIHSGNPTPLTVLTPITNKRLSEMEECHSPHSNTPNSGSLLPPGWVICNTDVAFGNCHSVGTVVFINEEQTVMRIYTERFIYCDPLAGEIAALYCGAAIASNLHLCNVIFQSDSVDVVVIVLGKRHEIQVFHYNIQEVVANFQLHAKSLNLWQVNWIPRRLNGVTKWAVSSKHFGNIDLSNFDDSLLNG